MAVATLMSRAAALIGDAVGCALVVWTAARLDEARTARLSAWTERASRHILRDADDGVWHVTGTLTVRALLHRATEEHRVLDIEAERCVAEKAGGEGVVDAAIGDEAKPAHCLLHVPARSSHDELANRGDHAARMALVSPEVPERKARRRSSLRRIA